MPLQLLALANSYKPGGRCLAGVNDTNDWVRPVADPAGAAISPAALRDDGRSVAPGDIISVTLGESVPLYFQTENALLTGARVSFQPALSARALHARLEQVAEWVPEFAMTPRNSIEANEYETLASDSLALLHTEALTMAWRTNIKGVLRPRAIFMTDQGGWDIPYTGEQWVGFPERNPGERTDFGPSYVTVSVGEALHSTHYVLAAGVLSA